MNVQEKIRQPATGKLRILHVLEATLGGTLRYLNDIINASDSDLYTYAIAYATERADPNLSEMLEHARLAGWQTFPLKMVRAVTLREDVGSIFALKKIIHSFRPNILHCHSSKAGAIGRLGRLVSRNYPKVVYSPHAIAANLGRQYLIIEKMLRHFTERYSAVSESERNELLELKICDRQSVDIVYPTIDTTHFEAQVQLSARSQLSLGLDNDVILGVGRLVKQKNPLFFLEVIKQVVSNHPSVRAIWVGEGEMRSEVESAIAALELKEVVALVGWQPDVRPYIAASSALLSSSCYESFGYMVAEALAMECPVVASDVTGTRDIMSESLAEWLYVANDTKQAASLIHALLNDRAKSKEVGALGREQMKRRFNREAMGKSLDLVYRTTVEK